MQLTVWTYEGPPHVGAMRIATAMRDVHYVLHAPQGDTYADLLFTMIERRDRRPPVTYTTFQARDLGGDTAQLFKDAVRDAYARFSPRALLVGASCTAELIQDDPGGLAASLGIGVPVIPLELPAYSKKENWGASETFYQVVRRLAAPPGPRAPAPRPSCNLLGPTALGFRHRDDVIEVTRLLAEIGVDVHVVAPLGASPDDVARLPAADFNVVMYPEIAAGAATWLERTFKQPAVRTVPIGVGATRDFIAEVGRVTGIDVGPMLGRERSRLPWYSRSVDSTYLTGKRVFIFGDGTHVVAAARIATEELGFTVVGLGTYARETAREVRAAAERLGLTALVTDDYLEVEQHIADLTPELVLGTQMERHIAKRLGIPCAVISAPVHVQDFPARYSPQMGFEGANVIFDSWVHPLVMGLEEHLLTMFREDFEFRDDAISTHGGARRASEDSASADDASADDTSAVAMAGVGVGAAAEVAGVAAGAPPHIKDALSTQDEHHHSIPAAIIPTHPRPEPPGGISRASDANGSRAGGAGAKGSGAGESGAGRSGANGSDERTARWLPDAERELGKIPFFVRGKARRNTERFAAERGVAEISLTTLYDAKAHYGK